MGRTVHVSFTIMHATVMESDTFRDPASPDSFVEIDEFDASKQAAATPVKMLQESLPVQRAECDDSFVICSENFSDGAVPCVQAEIVSRDTSNEARAQDMNVSPVSNEARGCARDTLPLTMSDLASVGERNPTKPTIISNIMLEKIVSIDSTRVETQDLESASPEKKRAKNVSEAGDIRGFEESERYSGPGKLVSVRADKSEEKWKEVIPEHIIKLASNGYTDSSKGPFVVCIEKVFPSPSEKDLDLGVLTLAKHMSRWRYRRIPLQR